MHNTAFSQRDSRANLRELTPMHKAEIVIKLGISFTNGSGLFSFAFFNRLNKIFTHLNTYLTSNFGAETLLDLKFAKIVSPPTQVCPTCTKGTVLSGK